MDTPAPFTATLSAAYATTVDYTIPLMAAATRAGLTVASLKMTDERFPATRRGTVAVEFTLVHFCPDRDRQIDLQDVLQCIGECGLRPAEVHELLAFRAAYPTIETDGIVVALGSCWRGLYPFAGSGSAGAVLGFIAHDPREAAFHRFLAVRL